MNILDTMLKSKYPKDWIFVKDLVVGKYLILQWIAENNGEIFLIF